MPDRKIAANRLEFMEFAINYADEGIAVVSENGKLVYVNDAQCRNLGYSREELLSMSVSDIDPSVTPEKWPSNWEKIRSAGTSTFTIETEHRTRGGKLIPIEVSIKYGMFHEEECCVAIVRNITDRKQAEKALRDSEARWQFALEGAGDGIWDMNFITKKVYFSSPWKSMLGYGDKEIGDTMDAWETLLHPDDRVAVFDQIERHMQGEISIFQSEHRLRCKDGSYKWILSRGKVIEWTEDGRPFRIIGTHTDISEIKQLQKKHEQLIGELQEALAKVKQLSGILPICSSCKKIRDDEGYWQQLESYIDEHSEAQFTHSVCPDCMKKWRPGYAGDKDQND